MGVRRSRDRGCNLAYLTAYICVSDGDGGVLLREVQKLMGHADFQTTLQYAHLSRDHVKSQVLKTSIRELTEP